MKKRMLFLFLSVTTIVFNLSCKKNPVEPIDNTQPGRRDYVWTVDTLESPLNTLQSIWGSSPNDIWVVGPGGTFNDHIWHYNGIKWKPLEQIVNTAPNCVFGLASNDGWIGGNDGKIFHYDGSIWNISFTYKKDVNVQLNEILDISGNSSNDIYALGLLMYKDNFDRPFILHFDGKKWNEEFVGSPYMHFLRLVKFNNRIIIFATKNDNNANTDTIGFYEYKNKNINTLIEKSSNETYWFSMKVIAGNLYFLVGRDMYRYNDNKFILITSFTENNFGYAILGGSSSKDIFVEMRDGLAHYNGSDLQYLYRFENNFTTIYDKPLFLDNEIFFAVFDFINGKNVILHGTLSKEK